MRFGRRLLLNEALPLGGETAGGELGEELQAFMLRALVAATTTEGRVDYERLGSSAEFQAAVGCAGRLRRIDPAQLRSRAARLAFWINVYNALVLHAVTALGVRRSVWEVWDFFGRVSYRVGDFTLSLDEIEHGILRGNRRPPFRPWHPFGSRDPRRALAPDTVDPRIHFALTCGARSCPPVGVYRTPAIEEQLQLATRNFVNQEVTLDARERIACSKIFKWYRSDFESGASLATFLSHHLDDGPVKTALAGGAPPCRAFRPYSWALPHPPAC